MKEEIWGLHLCMDLHECDPKKIRSASDIKKYVKDLCEMIKVKRFGKCVVVRFGEDERVAGFSMMQLIETSLISGHFVDLTNNAYIDVFSCKEFDVDLVVKFTKEFFKPKDIKKTVLRRI
ncbi:MAG: S-adenosylmethionine decarboxylase [Candidatus Aenigmatarchaeota archaeon]